MPINSVNLRTKLELFSEHWAPKIIARMNDTEFRLVKFQGEFVWHKHEDTDEAFLILEGAMTIHFRDDSAEVKEGELIVVPKGVEHKPTAEKECAALVIESSGTVNTGDAGGEMTVLPDDWS